MTLIPNFLASGLLTVGIALIFLLWATVWVERQHAGKALLLLSLFLLLVGGGYGPPIVGLFAAWAASRLRSRKSPHHPVQRFFAARWLWVYRACLAAWLALFPGSNLMGYWLGADHILFVPVLFFTAFGLMLLAILSAPTRDSQMGETAGLV